jgi:hypothetical protein
MSVISPEQIHAALKAKGRECGWRSDGIDSRIKFLQGLLELEDLQGNINHTQAEIGKAVGFKRRMVEIFLRSLVEAGALDYTPRPVGTPATYRLRTEWFDLPALELTDLHSHTTDETASNNLLRSTQGQKRGQGNEAKADRTATKTRTPNKGEPWQRAIDEVRAELGGQLSALTYQVKMLMDRLGAGVAGSDLQPQKIDAQPQYREQSLVEAHTQGSKVGIDANTTTTPTITDQPSPTTQPSIDAQTLFTQFDARLDSFTSRLEQVLVRLAERFTGSVTPTAIPTVDTSAAELKEGDIEELAEGDIDEPTSDDDQALNQEQPITATTTTNTDILTDDTHTTDHSETTNTAADKVAATTETHTTEDLADLGTPDPNQITQTTDPTAQLTKRRPGRPPNNPNVPNRLQARADLLFDQLSNLLEVGGLEQNKELINLAKAELAWQSENYLGEDGQPNWNTILKTNMRITKARLLDQAMASLLCDVPIDQLEGNADDTPLVQLIKLWGGTYDSVVEEHTTKINSQYREKAREQALDPTIIDISVWLTLARNILQAVVDGKQVQWEAVSFALALVTGRRQAEVHCTAQLLEVLTEAAAVAIAAPIQGYAVLFAGRGDRKFGQTKVRTGTEAEKEWLARPTRVIPTLVPADLVIAGWQWLEKNGHKVEHEDEVNAAFNGKLRTFMMKIAPGLSYKNLRDFYAVACWRNWLKDGVSETSLPERLKEVLGHGPLGDATPSYRKFCLQDESLARV